MALCSLISVRSKPHRWSRVARKSFLRRLAGWEAGVFFLFVFFSTKCTNPRRWKSLTQQQHLHRSLSGEAFISIGWHLSCTLSVLDSTVNRSSHQGKESCLLNCLLSKHGSRPGVFNLVSLACLTVWCSILSNNWCFHCRIVYWFVQRDFKDGETWLC